MKTWIKFASSIVTSLLLPTLMTSCGSTTTLKSTQGAELAVSARKFQKVIVKDFTTSVRSTGVEAEIATSTFPEHIAALIRRSGAFKTVTRDGPADEKTLVISGVITRYTEGSAMMRYVVGMGAGSAYFDATTQFSDSSGASLGSIVTDKNSWGLGGAIAATQTPQAFMSEAAQKIAAEARKFAP